MKKCIFLRVLCKTCAIHNWFYVPEVWDFSSNQTLAVPNQRHQLKTALSDEKRTHCLYEQHNYLSFLTGDVVIDAETVWWESCRTLYNRGAVSSQSDFMSPYTWPSTQAFLGELVFLPSPQTAFVGREEKRTPLKTPAWEATLHSAGTFLCRHCLATTWNVMFRWGREDISASFIFFWTWITVLKNVTFRKNQLHLTKTNKDANKQKQKCKMKWEKEWNRQYSSFSRQLSRWWKCCY